MLARVLFQDKARNGSRCDCGRPNTAILLTNSQWPQPHGFDELCMKLSGDPVADETYQVSRSERAGRHTIGLMDKLIASDDVADERLIMLARRWTAENEG
jgi:hypothetical protein